MPVTITFDTNTFDKVSRPALYSKDLGHAEMIEVHDALKRGDIRGFICDTALTLEGIGVDHRATVLGGTVARSSFARPSEDFVSITIRAEQPDRHPVHPKQPNVSLRRSAWVYDCFALLAPECRGRKSNSTLSRTQRASACVSIAKLIWHERSKGAAWGADERMPSRSASRERRRL
jgi:hypothetical protein